MLPVAEAQARVVAHLRPLPTEWVALPQARGRILAADLHAKRDQPPVAVSAMDGYAVRAADTDEPGGVFRVVGEAPAGEDGRAAIQAGETVRIFTGGALPPGANAIVIQENAERMADEVRFTTSVATGTFVRQAGLDFRRGWAGLAAGTALDGRALGLAASLGHVWLPVRRQPRIGLLATGNELRWPGETPEGSQIWSSNTVMLAAILAAWGAEPVDLGICPDEGEALAQRVREAAGLDMLVTTGGASVGDYDLVQQVLGREGMTLDFWKIAMRPGKPLLFGHLDQLPVLGFPGNPVSTAVCAIVFLRAALQTLLARPVGLRIGKAELASELGANDQRQDYMRAMYDDDALRRRVRIAGRQDSSMLATLAHADALLVRPPHDPPLRVGDMVSIIDLREALDNLR
jgi:molybdopterin molybdotransferase